LSFAVARLGGLLGFALAIGLLLHAVLPTLVVVLGACVFVMLWRLYRLQRWLRYRRTEDPPDFQGIWGDVIALVMRIYRGKQFHKRRILELFREFRRITTAMPDGVVLLGSERGIQWFNSNAARLLCLRRKIDYGQRLENLVRDPDFSRYLAAGDFAQPIVIRSLVDANIYLSLQVVNYGAGQQFLLVRDVTREARLEAMRKDFVANASHELRSPLTVVTGYVDALVDDDQIDAAWRGPLEEMRRQTERMRAVVDSLIELSRLESSTGEAGSTPVDVPGMLTLLQRDVMVLEQRPAVVHLSLESDAKLLGSEPELHSIFANLITNAVKYTPTTGSIDIRWWQDAAGAHFAVKDSGIGIARHHLPRLTERFYRVDPGRARATGGSGLGLAIVKHSVQRHGGTLEISSEEGLGSTFTCHFPARRVVPGTSAVAS
jgi:two-component system phosphate regulon sensor histidine kinase PhoR